MRFRKYITYITGEEILPSNQKQIFEQAKFTHSPLGKAFEKRIKTIEDQGIQIYALKDLKDKETQIKAIEDKSEDKISTKERMDETQKMSGEINFNNLTLF